MVTVWGEIQGITSPDGNLLSFTGLPYVIRSSVEGSFACMVNNANAPSSNYTSLNGYIHASTSKFRFYWSGSGQGWSAMTGNQLTTNGAIIYTMSYYTDS